jgi:hypothetical protein
MFEIENGETQPAPFFVKFKKLPLKRLGQGEKLKKRRWGMDLLEKLEFILKSNSFFFYIPSDLKSFLIRKEDFEKYKDILISKFEFIQDLPIVIKEDEIEYYNNDYDVYHYVRVISFNEKEIIEEKIQHNCFNESDKAKIFLKILFYFLKIRDIYEALNDIGLSKLIKKPD